MKRQMKLKNYYLKEMIRPHAIFNALKLLKDRHPEYEDICIKDLETWLEECLFQTDDDNNDNEETEMMSDISDSVTKQSDVSMKTDSDSEASNDKLDKVEENGKETRDQANKYNLPTCLVPEEPEANMIVNTTKSMMRKKLRHDSEEVHDIAPGEGRIPTNFMRQKNFIIKAFPEIFYDGQFGLDAKRLKKITPSKFFAQRLMNVNSICAKSPGKFYKQTQKILSFKSKHNYILDEILCPFQFLRLNKKREVSFLE